MKGKYFGNRVKHSMEIMCSAHVLLSPHLYYYFFRFRLYYYTFLFGLLRASFIFLLYKSYRFVSSFIVKTNITNTLHMNGI